jgi:tetratricopeptide (TPR) repeat protein/predicted transcriptional regulator
MPPLDDVRAHMDLVERRVDFLERLAAEPLRKRAMVDALDHSRSTVNRAVDDLENAGLVEPVDGGYATTVVGRLAARRYREYVADQRRLVEDHAVLAPLPADSPVDLALLADATVELADGPTPYEPLQAVERALRDADRVRGVLPALVDTRHLALCRSVAREDGDVALGFGADLHDRLVDDQAGLLRDTASAGARVSVVDPPRFCLLVTETGGDRTVTAVVFAEGMGVHGVVQSTHERAVDWATDHLDSLFDAGEDVTDDVAALDPVGDGSADRLHASAADGGVADVDDLLAYELKRAGFDRLTDEYVARRGAADPATAWRTGFEVGDVAAGYAIDRELPGADRTNLTDHLVDGLATGTDHALVGPPGTGKSTVLATVAHRWVADDRGPVFYREAGAAPFEATAALEEALARADGHALVVVEDAVRPDANAVFEVMASLAGADDVSVLVDARDDEWASPPSFPSDARVRSHRDERVTTVEMPPVDEREAERIVDHFADVVDAAVPVDSETLLASVRDADDPSTAAPGTMLAILHRLTRASGGLSAEGADGPTAMEADARETLERVLAADAPLAADAATLAAVLAAVGEPVAREYLHALAPGAGEGDAVEAAIDVLDAEGVVARRDGSLRAPHEEWALAFLAAVATEDDPARFGRVCSALLALADDRDARGRIGDRLADTSQLTAVATAPAEWASDLAEAVFFLVQDNPVLAPVLGSHDAPAVELPAVCPPETVASVAMTRGLALDYGGDIAAAQDEFRAVATDSVVRDEPVPEPTRTKGALRLTISLVREGAAEDALEWGRQALADARELSDGYVVSRAHNALGTAAMRAGEDDTARHHLEEALEAARTGENTAGIESMAYNLAQVEKRRGDLDSARTHAEESLEAARERGNVDGEAESLDLLAQVREFADDLDDVRETYRRAYSLAQDVGSAKVEATVADSLASLELARGALASAERYNDLAVEPVEAAPDDPGFSHQRHQRARARIALARDDLDEAGSAAATLAANDLDDPNYAAAAAAVQAAVARRRGDLDAAREHADRAVAAADDVTTTLDPWPEAYLASARVAVAAGDLERADADLAAVRSTLAERRDETLASATTVVEADRALAADDVETARIEYATALGALRDRGVLREAMRAVEGLASCAAARGDPDGVRERHEAARDLVADRDLPVDDAHFQTCLERAQAAATDHDAGQRRTDGDRDASETRSDGDHEAAESPSDGDRDESPADAE